MNEKEFIARIEKLERNVLGESGPSKFINGVLLALDEYRAAQPSVQRTACQHCNSELELRCPQCEPVEGG